jgi:hypothetical protein
MTSFNDPTNTSLYSTILATIRALIASCAKMDFSGDTNVPTGAIRHDNASTNRPQKWNGSSWVDLLWNIGTSMVVGDQSGTKTLTIQGGTGTDSGSSVNFNHGVNTQFILGTHSSIFGGALDGTASLWGSTGIDFKLYTNALERYFCNTDGIHFVNTTTIRNNSRINFDFAALGTSGVAINDTDSANGAVFIGFMTGGTVRGSITNVTNTAVAYNTTSDYRLKENVQDMGEDALDDVLAMRPVTFTWAGTEHAGDGFIAHELAEVVPQAVTGTKDAVNAEGQPMYQGVDASFLIGRLVKSIQILEARVAALENV